MNRLRSGVGIFSGEDWSWWYASRDCRGKMKKGIAGFLDKGYKSGFIDRIRQIITKPNSGTQFDCNELTITHSTKEISKMFLTKQIEDAFARASQGN